MSNLSDEQIDALDTFALHVMAPRQRESVREFARAVIEADRAVREKGASPAPADALRAALESIARNTCCEGCQEAARVARAALAPSPAGERETGRFVRERDPQTGEWGPWVPVHPAAQPAAPAGERETRPSFRERLFNALSLDDDPAAQPAAPSSSQTPSDLA
jgi:hypothetical protein